MQNELNEARELIARYASGDREVKAEHIREAVEKIPKPLLKAIADILNDNLKPADKFWESILERGNTLNAIAQRREK